VIALSKIYGNGKSAFQVFLQAGPGMVERHNSDIQNCHEPEHGL